MSKIISKCLPLTDMRIMLACNRSQSTRFKGDIAQLAVKSMHCYDFYIVVKMEYGAVQHLKNIAKVPRRNSSDLDFPANSELLYQHALCSATLTECSLSFFDNYISQAYNRKKTAAFHEMQCSHYITVFIYSTAIMLLNCIFANTDNFTKKTTNQITS